LANASFAFCDERDFLFDFFKFEPSWDPVWTSDFDALATHHRFLKFLPFKPFSSQFVHFQKAANVTDPFFSRFLFVDSRQLPVEQLQIAHSLQDFRDKEIERIEKLEGNVRLMAVSKFKRSHRVQARGFNAAIVECEQAIVQWERARLSKFVARIGALFGCIERGSVTERSCYFVDF
jgi:hypothetical protein